MLEYRAEGLCRNANHLSREELSRCMASGEVLQSTALAYDTGHRLRFELGGLRGIMPFADCVDAAPGETVKDIAVLTRVGRPTCFVIMGTEFDDNGEEYYLLSRAEAQRRCRAQYLDTLEAGSVIPCTVTHIENFGAFCDIGCGIAALLFAVTLLVRDPKQFRIRLKDIWCFIGTGICSLLFFTYCYFQAITIMDLSTAAVLLYTAPSIVMILSLILFHERITVQKLIALVLAFAGCCLVSLVGGEHKLSTVGILYGLGAGFGYALYSIFARYALDRGYSSNTINFYSCLLTTIGAAIIWGAAQPLGVMFGSWKGFGLCTALGIVTCYLPYLLYTYGLTGLETGKASILASFEPVVATLVGIFVFHEKLTPLSALGCVCVLSAVVLLNLKRRQKANEIQ